MNDSVGKIQEKDQQLGRESVRSRSRKERADQFGNHPQVRGVRGQTKVRESSGAPRRGHQKVPERHAHYRPVYRLVTLAR